MIEVYVDHDRSVLVSTLKIAIFLVLFLNILSFS